VDALGRLGFLVALELGDAGEHGDGEFPHRGGIVDVLAQGDERHAGRVQAAQRLIDDAQLARPAVERGDDDGADRARLGVGQEAGERRAMLDPLLEGRYARVLIGDRFRQPHRRAVLGDGPPLHLQGHALVALALGADAGIGGDGALELHACD
jgi:hypothetical protein